MGDDMITEGMLDMFIFETEQGLENLENICLESKDVGEFDEDNVNEIFRIMHTIKGSSAVMMFQNIATLAHKLEDVFYFIRESHPDGVPHDELVDDVLEVSDFITAEMEKIKDGGDPDEDPAELIEKLDKFLNKIQNKTDVDAGKIMAEKQEKARESEKQKSGAFDEVIDFDELTRDPKDPQRLKAEYSDCQKYRPVWMIPVNFYANLQIN